MPARSDSDSRFARFLDGKPRSATFPCAPAEGSLRLDRDEALGYLGYGDQELDCELAARFDAVALECEERLSPAYSWAAFAVERNVPDGEDAGVYLSGSFARLEGTSMAAHMEGAAGVALLSCTAGMASERAIARYQATSPTEALFYSACASALVEACANRVEAEVVAEASEAGLRTNWRRGLSNPSALQPGLRRCAAVDAARLTPSAWRTGAIGGELHRQLPARAVEEHHGGDRAFRAWNARGGREAKLRHVLARAGVHDTETRENMSWLAT